MKPRAVNRYSMAAVSEKKIYNGHPELGRQVDSDTWLTPRHILNVLGPFDLDPCAATEHPTWTGAKSHMTKEYDGLGSPWYGRVFMNPPFSNTSAWIRRHARHGRGISLVPATVENQVWNDTVWPKASAVLLLKGRTRFCNPDGSKTSGRPLRSIALIAWTPEDAAFLTNSGLPGALLTAWTPIR